LGHVDEAGSGCVNQARPAVVHASPGHSLTNRRTREPCLSILMVAPSLAILLLAALLRGGLLGRMQNLVSDVVSAETSQSKAERIMRETMELAWTKAAGAKVTGEEIIL
jgi:hypothetical protein